MPRAEKRIRNALCLTITRSSNEVSRQRLDPSLDSQTGSLFCKKPDETTLTHFGETGALRGANGIALGGDGTLYVTLSTGIARVDRATGEPTRLPQPDTVVTGGCDGLYWHGGDLLGIQNSTNPGRVVRIALTEKGTRIAGLTVLQSHHHPDFDEPATGAIANGALHAIGNSYVSHYQPDGSIKNVEDLKSTAIIAVPLRTVMSTGGTETKARVTTVRKTRAKHGTMEIYTCDLNLAQE